MPRPTTKRAALLAAALLPLSLAGQAVAQGDAERGEIIGYTCLGCHGVEGYRNAYPSFRVPMLGGQHPEYIVAALKAYKTGQRPHATMQAQASSLSDQDMQDVAAYFATYGEPKADPLSEIPDGAPEKLVTCSACHSANGISLSPEWPNLAGQHESYLRHALNEYKSGSRVNAVMAGIIVTLTDEDIRQLAAYFADREGLFTTHED
ncbi:MAG: cytochrome c [Gammaproteobacteria bacterium]